MVNLVTNGGVEWVGVIALALSGDKEILASLIVGKNFGFQYELEI